MGAQGCFDVTEVKAGGIATRESLRIRGNSHNCIQMKLLGKSIVSIWARYGHRLGATSFQLGCA